MVAVPADTPVTIPVDEPTVATRSLLLIHVPPDIALLKVVVNPVQTPLVPVMAGGLIETVAVAKQPVGNR
jgi:hypothetical protein